MYTVENFKTKKALKEAVASGRRVEVFQPGPFPGATNGNVALEGPHYPKPHTWYASAVIKDSIIVSVKILIASVLLFGTLTHANKKPVWSITHASATNQVRVTCANGGDPTVSSFTSNTVTLSCGR